MFHYHVSVRCLEYLADYAIFIIGMYVQTSSIWNVVYANTSKM